MYTALFWKDLLERLVATLVQVGGGLIAAQLVTGVQWEAVLVVLAGAAIGVFAKAFAALHKADSLSPASFVSAAPQGTPAVAKEEKV